MTPPSRNGSSRYADPTDSARSSSTHPAPASYGIDEEQLSKVELAKFNSDNLRGTIARTLDDDAAASFGEDDKVLIKFHGIYQQDDRDQRHAGDGKQYSMMIRVRIPGGALTWGQYLDLDRLADEVANGTLRLTTRQAIQYHGVAKGDLRKLMRGLNATLLSTLAACGDVQRNVMAPAAPFADRAHRDAQKLAQELALALAPASGAYHEIWLDGERVAAGGNEEEPFYGRQYLPRKFKTGVALDIDNSIDIYTYDAGLIGVTRESEGGGREIVSYNVVVGGGLGMTHNKPDTIARIGTPIALVSAGDAIEAIRTVGAIYRDDGNREDRRHARLKYLVEKWGVEKFTRVFRERFSGKDEVKPPAEMPPPRELDYLGVFEQGDGRKFYGVFVENGRVADTEHARYRTAFRRIVKELRPGVRLTPMQSILFTDLSDGDVARIGEIFDEHGVKRVDELSNVRRWSMACPALPTCGLALADSERIMPGIVDVLEREFAELSIGDVPLTVRMTGCPNGCARPYNADLAFVGRRPGVYHVFVGGGLGGDRLADLFAADVKVEDFVETLRPLLMRYRDERREGEALGDFYQRALAPDEPRRILTGKETPTRERVVQLGVVR